MTDQLTDNATGPTTGFSYTVSRAVDAPAARVWEAWTHAEQYARWFGARPGSVRLDVRPGGRWQAVLVMPDGSEFPMSGSYTEVAAPHRLGVAMDIPGAEPGIMLAEFTERAGRTEVTLSQTCTSREEHDQSKEGSGILLNQLAAYLAKD